MAITNSDGSIVLTTDVDTSGLKAAEGKIKTTVKSISKGFAVIGAAAAVASIAITKMAVDAYADYEQLVGGIETLFKQSADKVQKYAQNAFFTTTMSANEYMRTVTSFSASLISSLGGDTEKAADVANMALTDMADNANKMGVPLERIQMAYQSFARQQYVLLDNLSLGYGGTKTEMERLLKDAEAYLATQGKTANFAIDNLADVYTAINAIQQKLGITGTTALEAEKTISGSAAMMKAAWQNTLTAIAGGGDIDRAINNLVYSIQKYFQNILPVIEQSLQGIGTLIAKVTPMLVETVAKSLIQAIPQLLNAVYEMILGLARGIYQGIMALFSGEAVSAIEKQTESIQASVSSQNDLTNAVKETNKEVQKSVFGFDEVTKVSSGTASNVSVGAVKVSGGGISTGITQGVEQAGKGLKTKIPKFIQKPLENLIKWIKESFAPPFINAFSEAFDTVSELFGILEEPVRYFVDEVLSQMFSDVADFATQVFEIIGEFFSGFKEMLSENSLEIQNIVYFISDVLSFLWSVIKEVYGIITELRKNTLKSLTDFLGAVIVAISNFIDVFKNTFGLFASIFKGDLDGIEKYTKAIFANIVNIIISALNAVISVVNLFWSTIFNAFKGAVNLVGGIVSDIAGFLGADLDLHWDAEAPLIPTIPKYVPKLATGTVIPPNKRFLAELGDNTREHEVVSPLSTIKQAVSEVLDGESELPPIHLTVYLDSMVVYETMVERNNENTRRTGVNAFA